MVKAKENTPGFYNDGSIDVEQWLRQLGSKRYFQDFDLFAMAAI